MPTLAQDVIPSLARPLPEGDEGQYYARLARRLAERILQPITNPDPGPQASSEARQPMDAATTAPRHRLLAPAPAKQETVARDPEATSTPVLPRRKDLPAVPRRGIDRKKIAKVFAACMRCR